MYSGDMAYARDDIDLVRDKTDLVELASEITKVKKSGRSTMAVCPFHSEKTPSLSIDGARGLYYCFGCGKSGDIYRWVQETQAVDFAGAVEFLARRAGVTLKVDPEAAKRRNRRERLVEATGLAVAFYSDRLKSAPDAASARSYLRGRGYDGDVVDQFGIGYSPDEWDLLVTHLRDKGVREDTMTTAGLAMKSRTNSLIDRFRGRVMFPVYDLRGDAVGFGARVLDGDGPKYLNTAESPIYHKSRLLYGLNWAKSEVVRRGESVVVEGYTDVIAMHMAGLPIAVATCGTALVEGHLDLLRRFSERVVLAFDADEAGAGAALRGFERSVPGDLDLRVAMLPDGKDPADVVADGGVDALDLAIRNSVPLLMVRIDSELSQHNLSEPEARTRAVRAAAAVIALHPDPVARHEYAVMVSRRTGVETRLVEQAIRSASKTQTSDGRRTTQGGTSTVDDRQPEVRTATYPTEVELLRSLLANDERLADVEVSEDLFANASTLDAYRLIKKMIVGLGPGETPDLGTAFGSDESPAAGFLRRIALDDKLLADPAELVSWLQVSDIETEIAEIKASLQQMDKDSDAQGYSGLWTRLIALEQSRRSLRSTD
ncbi:MAG: DNA primase [Armatimonadetes bacterium]|nr:MAG: DNA primase [Armatimonadota bacterium]